jgi:hypothetical protein
MGDTIILETAEARELAQRWAVWHAFDEARKHDTGVCVPRPRWLEESELERLFAWVRAWMADRRRAGNYDACIGEALGLDDIDAAHALAHEATKAGPS